MTDINGINIKIKEVEIKRKFNLGNYETMDIGFIATVGENQNPEEIAEAVDKKIIEIGNRRRSAK